MPDRMDEAKNFADEHSDVMDKGLDEAIALPESDGLEISCRV